MIIIITIGKTKEKYLKEGIEEFLKRIKRYEKIEYQEINTFDNLKLDNKFVIVLDVLGKEHSSEGLAEILKKTIGKEIIFLIGDQEGIKEEIKKKANLLLSISRMTFTHEMARLILLEQVYRAITINKGMKYHK